MGNCVSDCFDHKIGTKKNKQIAAPNYTNTLQIINSLVGHRALEKISTLQEKAYQLEKDRLEIRECSVCWEEDVEMAPIKCRHDLCTICYRKLLQQKCRICPVCRTNMVLSNVNKFYVVMVPYQSGVGLLYLPPIYSEKENIWIDHELFPDFSRTNQIDNLVNSCQRIKTENYVIVLTNLSLKDTIKHISAWVMDLRVTHIEQKAT